ncbi:MAG: restriction endonuclease [Treponema sp.]|jgi:tetratricopeptide (TPR) repeat protein|nr:restriction endonuclease [Treponema sp.]
MILIIGNTFLTFCAVKYLWHPKQVKVWPKLLEDGNTQAVIRSAMAFIAKQPQNIDAHYYLGRAYLAEDKYSLALIEFKVVSQMGIIGTGIPELEFRQTMAQLFINCNQPEEALKEYLLLIKLAPEKAEFYYHAGKLFIEQNRSDLAKQYLYKAEILNPYDHQVHCELGFLLYKDQQTQEAKIELEKAIQSPEYNAQAYFYLGKILKDDREYAAAIQTFEYALKSKEYKIKAHIERGICYISLNAMNKAIAELELVIQAIGDEVHPDSLYARYFLGSCYEQLNQIDKAIVQWDKIAAIKKNFHDVDNKLVQYMDYRYDSLKDYLNYREEEFLELCKDMASKGMGFKVQTMKAITNGAELIVVDKNVIDENNRELYQLVRFYRMYELVHEQLIYDILEDLRRQNIHRCIIVTNSGFAHDALEYANLRPVELLGKDKLIELLQNIQ